MSDLIVHEIDAFMNCPHRNMPISIGDDIDPECSAIIQRLNHIITTFSCFRDMPMSGVSAMNNNKSNHHNRFNPHSANPHGSMRGRRATHTVARLTPRKAIVKDDLAHVRSSLNKLTHSNARTITQQVMGFCNCSTFSKVIDLILEKCFADTTYIHLYVRLMYDIQSCFPETKDYLIMFFQTARDELPQHLEGLHNNASATIDYEAFCKDQKLKHRLLNQNITYIEFIQQCIVDDIRNVVPDHFEYLITTLRNHKKDEDIIELMTQFLIDVLRRFNKSFPDLKPKMIQFYQNELQNCCNSRTRFKIMDVFQ